MLSQVEFNRYYLALICKYNCRIREHDVQVFDENGASVFAITRTKIVYISHRHRVSMAKQFNLTKQQIVNLLTNFVLKMFNGTLSPLCYE